MMKTAQDSVTLALESRCVAAEQNAYIAHDKDRDGGLFIYVSFHTAAKLLDRIARDSGPLYVVVVCVVRVFEWGRCLTQGRQF